MEVLGAFSLLGVHLTVWIPATILIWVMVIAMDGAWVINSGARRSFECQNSVNHHTNKVSSVDFNRAKYEAA